MKPIAIVQHESDTPAGYFATWLDEQRLPYLVVRIDGGEPVPRTADAFSGLCFMGGSMSVNDPLPWIADELALIRNADQSGVPVIGHCLGGQLLAKALGGAVMRNPVKEIGWHAVQASDAALAQRWLGTTEGIEFFQWHGDTFSVPPGARSFLASPLCAEQAFVIERPGMAHLGMQFHCEMTPALVQAWCASGGDEIAHERAVTGGPGVQSATEMLADAPTRSARMHTLARHLYARWAEGLRRD